MGNRPSVSVHDDELAGVPVSVEMSVRLKCDNILEKAFCKVRPASLSSEIPLSKSVTKEQACGNRVGNEALIGSMSVSTAAVAMPTPRRQLA